MADIRDRIEEDRGLLKKIQTYVPGFRGYRRREDIRDADRMLRARLAHELALYRRGLEECRGILVQNPGSRELEMVGGLISQFKKLEGNIAHAAVGYSGIAADIAMKEDELDRLYEYDLGMLDHLRAMSISIEGLKNALMAADERNISRELMNIRARAADFEERFSARLRVIEGTEV